MPFMNKYLSRAFMRRSQLRNKYLKKHSETNRLAYVKQRNFFKKKKGLLGEPE